MDRYQRVPLPREPEEHAENEVGRRHWRLRRPAPQGLASTRQLLQAHQSQMHHAVIHRQHSRRCTFPAAVPLRCPSAVLRCSAFCQVRITSQGKSRSYISYGTSLLTEKGHSSVVLKAMGKAINKTVTIGARRLTCPLACAGSGSAGQISWMDPWCRGQLCSAEDS